MVSKKYHLNAEKEDLVQYEDGLEKKLRKLPDYIIEKLKFWAKSVNTLGILKVRQFPGFHDEPLKGYRKGQRSIRLSKSYRAIYIEDKIIVKIIIIEVNKHEY